VSTAQINRRKFAYDVQVVTEKALQTLPPDVVADVLRCAANRIENQHLSDEAHAVDADHGCGHDDQGLGRGRGR